jgi:hypothetical protein
MDDFAGLTEAICTFSCSVTRGLSEDDELLQPEKLQAKTLPRYGSTGAKPIPWTTVDTPGKGLIALKKIKIKQDEKEKKKLKNIKRKRKRKKYTITEKKNEKKNKS